MNYLTKILGTAAVLAMASPIYANIIPNTLDYSIKTQQNQCERIKVAPGKYIHVAPKLTRQEIEKKNSEFRKANSFLEISVEAEIQSAQEKIKVKK